MAKKNNIRGSRKANIGVVFTVWWLICGSIHVWILQYFGVTYNKALADATISYLLLGGSCLFIINNMRYYLPKKEKYLYVIVMSFAITALWLALLNFILKAIYKHDDMYLQLLQRTLVIRYVVAFLMIACNILLSLIWYTQKEQQEETDRRTATEKLARDAELNKLRQQLQPHFLFNSLNSISALTGLQPEKARHMIQQLSDFLRGTLRNEGQQWVSLKDEMEYLQLYLDIEKVRFGYRLQSKTDCEEAALQMTLPSMLLQPLVENAIKFGLYDTIGEVEILIAAKKNGGMLQVTVQNPYDESTAMPMKGTGFGLASIRRRLFLLFGRQDLLQLKKEANQFIVVISIPQIINDNKVAG
ncbi:sensor histidine kinase [Ferruginibacter sp. SUN106]|uniref:sensor histidine kinase n=1 Tax=Ferruginibacter sp. SUN106 TaxID=2978348 RepID=UPI003D359EB3